ncbi:MAG: CDP-diacylglycerol--serine O-phosphatidyltransferase [Bacteroidales bacterium]
MRKHIPNGLTLGNLFFGCLSITAAFHGQLPMAAWLILIAAMFDFFDGFAARLLNARSPIGKELDSLADVVSFGLAPGVILYHLLLQSENLPDLQLAGFQIIPFVGFLIPLFSALRLAKFNIDERQETVFYGLPTPANALFIASLPLLIANVPEYNIFQAEFLGPLFSHAITLIILSLVLSYLLVSEIPFIALKFKSLVWSSNKPTYILLMGSLFFLIVLGIQAIPFILAFYIVVSFFSRNRIT